MRDFTPRAFWCSVCERAREWPLVAHKALSSVPRNLESYTSDSERAECGIDNRVLWVVTNLMGAYGQAAAPVDLP